MHVYIRPPPVCIAQAFTFLPALGAYVFVFAYTVRKYSVVKKLWHEVSYMDG